MSSVFITVTGIAIGVRSVPDGFKGSIIDLKDLERLAANFQLPAKREVVAELCGIIFVRRVGE